MIERVSYRESPFGVIIVALESKSPLLALGCKTAFVCFVFRFFFLFLFLFLFLFPLSAVTWERDPNPSAEDKSAGNGTKVVTFAPCSLRPCSVCMCRCVLHARYNVGKQKQKKKKQQQGVTYPYVCLY